MWGDLASPAPSGPCGGAPGRAPACRSGWGRRGGRSLFPRAAGKSCRTGQSGACAGRGRRHDGGEAVLWRVFRAPREDEGGTSTVTPAECVSSRALGGRQRTRALLLGSGAVCARRPSPRCRRTAGRQSTPRPSRQPRARVAARAAARRGRQPWRRRAAASARGSARLPHHPRD